MEPESAGGLWKQEGYANGVCTQPAPPSMPTQSHLVQGVTVRGQQDKEIMLMQVWTDVTGELTAL